MDFNQEALRLHEKHRGKIEIVSKVNVNNADDLSTAYTPGVAEPCRKIHQDRENVYKYTAKGNMVAIVSDGTAVLGLGNIGPEAALPVMEGKAVLFKNFGRVDAFPICVDTTDVDEIVDFIVKLSPVFGGINLEDIAAPRCIEIERKLKAVLNIPVFHDDQHGTAIVVAAGLINALKLAEKDISQVRAVVNGAGSAGLAITKLLLSLNIGAITLCDKQGVLRSDMPDINEEQRRVLTMERLQQSGNSLSDALVAADVFIGVSAPNLVSAEMVSRMKSKAIVFAMANPDPEIMPEEAKRGGAFVVGTGRSDFANQVNNVLAFPGVFRGALDVRATDINEEMKVAAAYAIADTLSRTELSTEQILPKSFDERICQNVAEAVGEAARKSGVARL